jgi:hypothetical protein
MCLSVVRNEKVGNLERNSNDLVGRIKPLDVDLLYQ